MFSSSLDEPPNTTHILNMFRRSSSAGVLARRAGRVAFGGVLIAGALRILQTAENGAALHASRLFALTWALAIAAALVVRLVVWLVDPAPRGDALLKASLVVPAAGLALVMPLSLHLLVMRGDPDSWVRMSIHVVGFAHVVFAVLFAARAAGLARSATPRMSIGEIFFFTVLASFLPWPFIIPQAITAITGIFILPVLFAFDWLAARERDALPVVPRAIVAPCRA
jgi:hypothetical protein